jgi:hypothetical protein
MSAPEEPHRLYQEFAKSVTPLWRHQELEKLEQRYYWDFKALTSIVDISLTGNVHGVQLELTESESCFRQEYQSRLEAERQALRKEDGDIAIRLVIFRRPHQFVRDLYGVEFQIEPSFFLACGHGLDHRSLCVLQEEPPCFIDLGRKCCVKFVDGNYDHPLTRKGVTISKGSRSLCEAFLLTSLQF